MENYLNIVEIDDLVIMKIIKHGSENILDLPTGLLLGLDIGSTLQVTNCFPFLSHKDEEINEESATYYQIEMMRCLREINVDNNSVGWYTCTNISSLYNKDTIETQYNYQESLKKAVIIVYDPLKTSQGIFSLKAFQLTPSFMELYKMKNFTKENLTKENFNYNDIFQEIPIKIHNSLLTTALLTELEENNTILENNPLEFNHAPFLERDLELISENIDDLGQKIQNYQRNVQRQLLQQQQWLKRRKAENLERKSLGQPLLPETPTELEKLTNPIWKPISDPSPFDLLLITDQIDNICSQINELSTNSFTKLYLTGGLQKNRL